MYYEKDWDDIDEEMNCVDCKHCEDMVEGFDAETVNYGKLCKKGKSNLNGFPFINTNCLKWERKTYNALLVCVVTLSNWL